MDKEEFLSKLEVNGKLVAKRCTEQSLTNAGLMEVLDSFVDKEFGTIPERLRHIKYGGGYCKVCGVRTEVSKQKGKGFAAHCKEHSHEALKNTYTKKINSCDTSTTEIDLVSEAKRYWDLNPMSATKDIAFRFAVEKETSFLDYQNPLIRHRMYCVINGITEESAPKCPTCGKMAMLHKKKPETGFRKFCSVGCAKADNKISPEAESCLKNYDWLYEKRIKEKLSKERIADILGVSITPVNEYLNFHGIPDVRYNESEYKTKVILENKEELEDLYKDGLTQKQIAEVIGSSPATVSLFMKKHGIEAREPNFYDRKKGSSAEEDSLYEWISGIYKGEIVRGKRNLCGPNLEVDLYFPELNFAIEYNGLYSHIFRPNEEKGSIRKDRSYHYGKTINCKKAGVELFHLWSDLWMNQREKTKFFIMNKLNLNTRIYARNTTIREISVEEKNDFLDLYHLQGRDKSKFKYGLFHGADLVCVMTFGKAYRNKNVEWELKRFCSGGGITVVGGFSKLLTHFRRNHPGSIVSYADLSYSGGNVYQKNGFRLVDESGPSYQYVNLKEFYRTPKTGFTKKSLVSQLNLDHNESMAEAELMRLLGFDVLYDCGTLTFVID